LKIKKFTFTLFVDIEQKISHQEEQKIFTSLPIYISLLKNTSFLQ